MHLILSALPQIEPAEGPPIQLAPRDAVLLAWLVVEGPTTRARMASLLWPSSSDTQARSALRQRLLRLEKTLGTELIRPGAILQICDGVGHDLAGEGGLLGDMRFPDAPELDAWLQDQREQRIAREQDGLQVRAQALEDAGQFNAALKVAQSLLSLDPLCEAAHRRVMRLHSLMGDRASALLAFDRCESLLKGALGARPSNETLSLLGTIETSNPAVPDPARRRSVPASMLRPPLMVGREPERRSLQHAWDVGLVAAVIGEAGMGKSRLLTEFSRQNPGVVYVAGRPGDVGVPYATLARLLRAVGDKRSNTILSPQIQGQLARVLPELDETGLSCMGGQRLQLGRAVADFLRGMSQPSGVVVDDLHFADAASVEMLQELTAEAADLRWALAFRPAQAETPLLALQAALTEAACLVPIPVAPLDEEALVELMEHLGLGLSGRTLCAPLLKRTGGNPLFVLETLKQAWVEEQIPQWAAGADLPKPMSVERLIDARIDQLSPGALALARVASIAGVDFTIGLAEAVLGIPAMRLADPLAELESAHVLKGTQFAHDLVFDAVLRGVPFGISEHTHAEVAAWLERVAGEPARVARHWIAARRPELAVKWLSSAAERARVASRLQECVGFLKLKAEIEESTGSKEEAFKTQRELIRLCTQIDFAPEASEAQVQWLETLADTDAKRAEILLLRANNAVMTGEDEKARDFAQNALHEAIRLGATALAMQSHLILAFVLQRLLNESEALVHAQSCLGWVEEHGSWEQQCELNSYLGVIQGKIGSLDNAIAHHERAVDIARAAGAMMDCAGTLANLAETLSFGGRSLRSIACLQEVRRIEAIEEGAVAFADATRLLACSAQLRLGHYDEALRADAEAAALEAACSSSPGFRDSLATMRAMIWCHLGQWARVQQVLSEGFAKPDPSGLQRARRLWVLHLLEGSKGTADVGSLDEALALDLDVAGENRNTLLLLRAHLLGAPAGLGVVEEVRQRMARRGSGPQVVLAHLVSARLTTLADPEAAGLHAMQALKAAENSDLGLIYRGELWLYCAQALLAGSAHVQGLAVLKTGLDWIDATSRNHVPTEFRESFLHRNPVNRKLLALGARNGVAATR